jgi:hypothetical protein
MRKPIIAGDSEYPSPATAKRGGECLSVEKEGNKSLLESPGNMLPTAVSDRMSSSYLLVARRVMQWDTEMNPTNGAPSLLAARNCDL